MPIWLSFLICTTNGLSCHVTVPTDQPSFGIAACQLDGMKLAPQWTQAHPGWRIAKIRCSIGTRPQTQDEA